MTYGHPVLVFEPAEELVFRDKLGHVTGVQLIIKNKNIEEIYFKVKSTASKFYSVRPSSGTIKPHGQIKVIIQPHDDSDKSLDVIEENNHRFMIQSAFVDNKSPKTAEDFWQSFDKSKVPVTTAKLHVRVKRLVEPTSSNEAINGGIFEHRQGLVDQDESFALAHFHVQNGAKDKIKTITDCGNVKSSSDNINKNKDETLKNIPLIPLIRDNVVINEIVGLESATTKENKNEKDTKVVEDVNAIDKEVQVDNKELDNSLKSECDLKESPKNITTTIINNNNNGKVIENDDIEKTNLVFGSSNGECTEEMSAQLPTSPLPRNNQQTSQLTFANTSIDGKINNLSTTVVKQQQKPLYNPSQFCYYPMSFMESFNVGVESGNGYYGRYIASVLDKMPKKMTIALKRDIAELIAKYEQQVVDNDEEFEQKN